MPSFGKRSLTQLATCDERLQRICNEVIKVFDFTVLEGHRGEAAQNKAYAEGKSKLKWPKGNHNKSPSLAVDLAPWPIDWNNRERFFFLAGLMLQEAAHQGVKLRWGGNWSGSMKLERQRFDDLPHFEIDD